MDSWPNGRLLSTAARLVEHAWVEALDSLGLTHAGLIVLHLLDTGPQSQTELARQARVQTQTMSRTLDRLQRQGLVARIRDDRDARRHAVTRTDAGTVVWHQARNLEAEVFPALENAEELRAALLQIITASSAQRW
jgi:DNA-binding MarR family transcriptional regulator